MEALTLELLREKFKTVCRGCGNPVDDIPVPLRKEEGDQTLGERVAVF